VKTDQSWRLLCAETCGEPAGALLEIRLSDVVVNGVSTARAGRRRERSDHWNTIMTA